MKSAVNVFVVLRTLLSYLLMAPVLVLTMIPLLLLMFFMPGAACSENKVVFWLLDRLYKGVLWCSLQKITVIGKENLPAEPAIFVANHQSAVDILFLGSLVNGYPHMWYALAYYAQMPVLGFFIRCIGMPLDRSRQMGAGRSLMRGIELVKEQKRHIMIFPEGARFNDGVMHEFLRGFAVIARKTGRPVVPVFMPYNGIVYPPQSFWIYAHPLVAVIGKTFELVSDETDELFVQRVYQWFKTENQRWS